MTAASYGKKRLSRELCNGQKDSAQVYTNCLYDATDEVKYSRLFWLQNLDENIVQKSVEICLGERPLQGKFLLCLLNGGDKVIGVHQVPVARQFRLQKGPEELAHHRICLW